MRISIILLVLIGFLYSCSKSDNTIEIPPPVEIIPSNEFFPLAINNFWEYEESYSSIDTSYTRSFTLTVTDTEYIGNFKWYKIERVRTGWIQYRKLMIENDSVYELQSNFHIPIRSLQYIIPSQRIESFPSWYGGDVQVTRKVERLDTTINTEIGQFNNCYKYEFRTGDYIDYETIAYGIGIIERKTIGYNFRTGEQTFLSIEKITNAKIN